MSELLSSDVLEHQFGPTELEVLKQDETGRIICTKVTESGKILELSQVVFRPESFQVSADEALKDIHQAVLVGASMGKAFAGAGIPFQRNIHASYRYDQRTMPGEFAKRFENSEPPIVTDLTVLVGPNHIPYADILEVFNPHVQPWELTGGDMGDQVAERLDVFSAELATLGDAA